MTAATFEHVEAHRAELKAHCYRMLGSAFDAEDAVQETLVRAWRFADRFEGRTTLRGWLYRIATNVCLTMIKSGKAKRLTPYLSSPPAKDHPRGPLREIPWLEPYPENMLESIPDSEPSPHARYEQKEATELAFVAAIAYLPPRQRAALLLADVLGWSANEIAAALEMSVASVNSALQRARETVRKKLPRKNLNRSSLDRDRSNLLDRYIAAWNGPNIAALVSLLKEDAIFSMPPQMDWYQGRDQISELLAWAMDQEGHPEWIGVATSANFQPAMALFVRDSSAEPWRQHAIHVLTIERGEISVVNNFMDLALFQLWATLHPE